MLSVDVSRFVELFVLGGRRDLEVMCDVKTMIHSFVLSSVDS